VRGDEVGLGQSPGELNTMSRDTSLAFVDVIEWSASQPWSSGKVGLLGVSYYAGSQWRVAARQPKGLTCIIPWEGMSDYYRDRCRHGGILSNTFIDFWWNRQVCICLFLQDGYCYSIPNLTFTGHHEPVWSARKSCTELGSRYPRG
jgi:putative CocE/NonD family hydrolase